MQSRHLEGPVQDPVDCLAAISLSLILFQQMDPNIGIAMVSILFFMAHRPIFSIGFSIWEAASFWLLFADAGRHISTERNDSSKFSVTCWAAFLLAGLKMGLMFLIRPSGSWISDRMKWMSSSLSSIARYTRLAEEMFLPSLVA